MPMFSLLLGVVVAQSTVSGGSGKPPRGAPHPHYVAKPHAAPGKKEPPNGFGSEGGPAGSYNGPMHPTEEQLAALHRGHKGEKPAMVTVQNLDDYFALGLYFAGDGHLPMDHSAPTEDFGLHERLVQVIPPGGRATQKVFPGHRIVVRSADFKFRAGVQLHDNKHMDDESTHPYVLTFRNLAFEDQHSMIELKAHDYLWIHGGYGHSRRTGPEHPFELIDSDNVPRVTFKLHEGRM